MQELACLTASVVIRQPQGWARREEESLRNIASDQLGEAAGEWHIDRDLLTDWAVVREGRGRRALLLSPGPSTGSSSLTVVWLLWAGKDPGSRGRPGLLGRHSMLSGMPWCCCIMFVELCFHQRAAEPLSAWVRLPAHLLEQAGVCIRYTGVKACLLQTSRLMVSHAVTPSRGACRSCSHRSESPAAAAGLQWAFSTSSATTACLAQSWQPSSCTRASQTWFGRLRGSFCAVDSRAGDTPPHVQLSAWVPGRLSGRLTKVSAREAEL